jgi:hypothetical protein
MAQRKLAVKQTPGQNTPFIPFWNQRPNYNTHSGPPNPQRQYNSSNAPPSMSNIPVPMDLERAKSWSDWRAQGRGNPRGQWRGRANVTDASQWNVYNCFSCSEEGHFTKNCPHH